ncbi:MAG: hypothetical protein V2J25_16655 [Desulfatiglans sp.]|nr:hypothetical protein [Thermodesulfobacteriota bacterium]MEE4354492.1 hypothetical protein [Desulfatiglans sp.]
MAKSSGTTITEEVESRLDDIFQEDDVLPDFNTEVSSHQGPSHRDINEILPDSEEDAGGGRELPAGVLSDEGLSDLDLTPNNREEPPPLTLEETPMELRLDSDDVEDSGAIELSSIFENTEAPPPIELKEEDVLEIDSDDSGDPPPIELSEVISDELITDDEENETVVEEFSFDELSESSQSSSDMAAENEEPEELSPLEIMDESGDVRSNTDYLDSAYLIEQDEELPQLEGGVSDIPGSHLEELRAIVLSIDWEIDEQIMNKLIEHLEELKGIYEGDKIITIFLQILGSLGKYVKVKGANAHPHTIQVMNSLFLALEKVIVQDIDETERKRILLKEAAKFKKLKEEISLRKARSAEEKEPTALKEVKPSLPRDENVLIDQNKALPVKEVSPHEAFAYALEEIKEVIKAEFRSLRAELKLWREDS